MNKKNANARVNVGDLVCLAVQTDDGKRHVIMHVVEVLSEKAARGLCRVAVFAGARSEPLGPADVAQFRGEVLFVVCFAVDLHVRKGVAHVIGWKRVGRLVRELAPRELWNMAVIAKAVTIGWRAGDDEDALFEE